MKLKKAPKGLKNVGRKEVSTDRSTPALKAEFLVSVAIMRGDETHHGFKSHRELRQSLGDAEPDKRQRGDLEGFWTSEGRFVTRGEAARVGVAAGQLHSSWIRPGGRTLLSSDVW